MTKKERIKKRLKVVGIKKKRPKIAKPRLKTNAIAMAVILIGILLIVVFLFFSLNAKSKIIITLITDESCNDCFDVNGVVDYVKSKNVSVAKVESFDYKSDEAKRLISRYGIKKVPTIVVRGNVKELDIEDITRVDDALVLMEPLPPYREVDSDKVRGYVSLIYLKDSNCNICVDLKDVIDSLKGTGIRITNERIVEFSSTEGKGLVEAYKIEKIPTIIMDEEAGLYENMRAGWSVYGTFEDNVYVMRKIRPLYYNVKEGRIKGLVDATFLTDSSCGECYNVSLHDPILTTMGIKFNRKHYVDVADPEGQELVKKYNITFVPTIILSDELGEYYTARLIFEQFFTIEEDGSYVFKNFNDWRGIKYKDLSTGEIKAS